VFKRFLCKHKWKILSETTTKSRAEHGKEIGLTLKHGGLDVLDRKFIQVITCSECGKLKRFVENI